MTMRWLILCGSLMFSYLAVATAQTPHATPLMLAKTFSLRNDATGRFDHFAADMQHNRLFVVLKDYKAIMVLDLRSGRVIYTIEHLGVPQGVFYRSDLDTIYVADGERGTVEIIDGQTYRTRKSVKLRLNADAIAYDSASQYLYVVNGGADAKMSHSVISVVDTSHGETVGEIEVDGDTLEAMARSRVRARSCMSIIGRKMRWRSLIDKRTGSLPLGPLPLGRLW